MLLKDGDTGTPAWQYVSEVASMAYDRHNHPITPASSDSHEMGTPCPIAPGPVIGQTDPWYLTSNGRFNLNFADNVPSIHSSFPALWSGVQQPEPHSAPDFSIHEASQGDSQAYSTASFYHPHPLGQTDYSPITSPLSPSFTSADSFSSTSPSSLSVDLDTIEEGSEPRMSGAVKNVVGSQKIAAAAYKRRSRNVKFICPYNENGCEAEFTARHNLEYHINSHTGRKPYKCKKGCPYAAPSPATVRRHEKACQG